MISRDSNFTREQALEGTLAPPEIASQQELVDVRYFNFEGQERIGQIVVNQLLSDEVLTIFEVIYRTKFPLQSVIPANYFGWSDDRSMEANNSSAFNYRLAVGKTKLSQHSQGAAIDLNPVLNPYLRGDVVLPPGAVYRPGMAGTLTADSPVVAAFIERGWTWGGAWTSLKDWHHFEKTLG